MSGNEKWEVYKEFYTHIIGGVISFFVISLFAILLHKWIAYLETNVTNINYVVMSLRGIEHFLFGVDALLVVILILYNTYKLLKSIWRDL